MTTRETLRYRDNKRSPEETNPWVNERAQELWADFVRLNQIAYHISALSKCPFQFVLGNNLHRCGDDSSYCYFQTRSNHLRGDRKTDEIRLASNVQFPNEPDRRAFTNSECYMGKPTHIALQGGRRLATSHKCPAESDQCATYRDALLANTGLTWIQTSPDGNWYLPGSEGTVFISTPETLANLRIPDGVTIVRQGAAATTFLKPTPINIQTKTDISCQLLKHCGGAGKAAIHVTQPDVLVCVKCAANEESRTQWQVRYDMNFKDYAGAHWATVDCRTGEC